MKDEQRRFLMGILWPDVCAAKGWDRTDRVRRIDAFSNALGRPLESGSDISSAEFPRLCRGLERLLATKPETRSQKSAVSRPPAADVRPLTSAPRRRATITSATERMLEQFLGKALNAHCRRYQIESLTDADAAAQRDEWTAEALGIDRAAAAADPSRVAWDILDRRRGVDLLKAYLIWMADPDSDEKRAAWVTAGEDGDQRRLISNCLENARLIRRIQQALGETDSDWYLTEAGVEAYVEGAAVDKTFSQHWRNLLPALLNELMITLEERARSWVRKGRKAHVLTVGPSGKIYWRTPTGSYTESGEDRPTAPCGPPAPPIVGPVPASCVVGLRIVDSPVVEEEIPF